MTIKEQVKILAGIQKAVLTEIGRMPKIKATSTNAQLKKLAQWVVFNEAYLIGRIKDLNNAAKDIYYSNDTKTLAEKRPTRPGTKPVRQKTMPKKSALPTRLKNKLKRK